LRQEILPLLAIRYLPEEGCFFKGEDPWRLACTTPGLLQIQVAGRQAWPDGIERASWDCYQCNLDIVLTSSAPRAEVEAHFRCVPEQLAYFEPASVPKAVAGPCPAMAVLRQRVAMLWADQCALLKRPALSAGTIIAARLTLRRLLGTLTDPDAQAAAAELDALTDATPAPLLLAWAERNAPGKGEVQVADGPAEVDAAPQLDGKAIDSSLRADDPGGAQKVLKVGQEKIDRLMT